jgi:microcystin-dependent protein
MASAISQQVLGLATSTSPGLAQAGGYNILPAGIVFPYAGGTAPTGFLICDGSQLAKASYAALYSAIGDDYATQIDPTTGSAYAAPDEGNFRLPDYRGIFLRGVGTPSGLDAVTRGTQQVDKTKKNGLSASAGSSSASVAGEKNQLNNSTGSASNTSWLIGVLGATSSGFGWGGHSLARGGTLSGNNGDGSFPGQDHSHSFSYGGNFSASGTAAAQSITVANGDNETRPINKGVNYIIKA